MKKIGVAWWRANEIMMLLKWGRRVDRISFKEKMENDGKFPNIL